MFLAFSIVIKENGVSFIEVSQMLRALNQRKEVIAAKGRKKSSGPFYCPGCQKEVILRQGPKRQLHFAHQTSTDCQTYSEGETKEHLEAKQLLFEWFQDTGIEIEAFLPKLQQRPDLCYKNIAIEVQCSSLKFSRFLERTTTYLANGYQPWWILGTKLYPKRQWSFLVKACCTYQSTGFCLWLIDTRNQALVRLNQIKWHYQEGVSSRRIATQKGEPYRKETLRPLCATEGSKTHNFSEWVATDYRLWVIRKLRNKLPKIREIQEIVYPLNGNVSQMPLWCYCESRFGILFEHRILIFRFLYLSDCPISFEQWLIRLRQLHWHWHFPLLDQREILREIFQECQYLENSVSFSSQ